MSTPMHYDDDGQQLPGTEFLRLPDIPLAVRETCKRKDIRLSQLTYNTLCNYWHAEWRGMYLGIEPDGYAHT